MQIWRTTRSAPGTSSRGARLVRHLCCVLTMLLQKGFDSSSIWSVSFRPGCEFCVSECNQKGVKSFTEKKVCLFFLSVCQFTSKGKKDRGKELTIAEGTEKVCSLHFRLKDLSKYVTDRIQLQAVDICFHWFQRTGQRQRILQRRDQRKLLKEVSRL